MRLDKFIAQQLGVSRAIARREIRGNHVTVDGDIIKNAAFKLLRNMRLRMTAIAQRSNTGHTILATEAAGIRLFNR